MLYCSDSLSWAAETLYKHNTHIFNNIDSRDSLRKEGFLKVHNSRVQYCRMGQS